MHKNDNVVVAVFEDRAAADAAIERLKKWDKATDDIKLGAVGLLYKDDGEVKVVVGHQGGRGLKVGVLVGIIAGVLTGGVGLLGGAAAGGLMGGVTGSFFTKSLNLNEAECNALGMELELGKAAVVVTCDDHEVKSTRLTLEHVGGVVKVYIVPADAVNEAAVAMAASDPKEIKGFAPTYPTPLTEADDELGGVV